MKDNCAIISPGILGLEDMESDFYQKKIIMAENLCNDVMTCVMM